MSVQPPPSTGAASTSADPGGSEPVADGPRPADPAPQASFPPRLDGPDVVEQLNRQLGELNERMGVEFLTADRERMTARMPVAGNRQPAGLLHGGANGVLAESLGSIHAFLLAPTGTMPVGIELSCTHHRSARQGDVVGASTPLHVGRTLATFAIDIRDDAGRAVCSARLSCMFLPRTGGSSTP